jgi:hypothetical protein
MSYAFFYDVPGDEEMYRLVQARIGESAADGLVVHVVTTTEGGLRHLNVWQSKEHWQRYQRERVAPAVSAVLAAAGISVQGAPPAEQELQLIDIQLGR